MHLDQTLIFLLDHKELFISFLLSLLAIIKLTAWGKAQAAALDSVIGVIERLGANDVKAGVARTEAAIPQAAKDAIRDSVAKADPKKTPLSAVWRFAREIFRGL